MGEYSHIPNDFDNVSNSQVHALVSLGFRAPIYSDLLSCVKNDRKSGENSFKYPFQNLLAIAFVELGAEIVLLEF